MASGRLSRKSFDQFYAPRRCFSHSKRFLVAEERRKNCIVNISRSSALEFLKRSTITGNDGEIRHLTFPFSKFFFRLFFGSTENRKMEPALVQFRLIGFNTGSWRRHLRWHPLPICCLGWWWVGGCYCCWRMTSEMCQNLRNCVTGNWQGLDREALWWRVSFFLQKCLILKTTEKVLFADSMELQKKLWDRNLCWNHDKSIGLLIFHSRNSNFLGDLNSITQHFMKFSRYKKTLKNHRIKVPIMQFILHFNLFLNQH